MLGSWIGGGAFKLTEQGEAIPVCRYRDDRAAAHRAGDRGDVAGVHSGCGAAGGRRFAVVEKTLDEAARTAYHRLVKADGFAEWFGRVTPLEELGQLPLGSRPARRGVAVSSLEDLRAIPWVFAWSQARVNAPGWYGLGSALSAVGDVAVLRDANQNWPLFQVMLENAEMRWRRRPAHPRPLPGAGRPAEPDPADAGRARADDRVGAQGARPGPAAGRRAVLGRAVELRNPYVDALSYLQLRALRTLRTDDSLDEEQIVRTRRLLLLTVSGVAAGLQNTG